MQAPKTIGTKALKQDITAAFDDFIKGLFLSKPSNETLRVAKGSCRSASNEDTIILSSVLIKNLDPWEAGDNKGMVPSTVIIEEETFYPLFIIKKRYGTDIGIDTSLDAHNLLTEAGEEYNEYRQIGWITFLDDGEGSFFIKDLIEITVSARGGFNFSDNSKLRKVVSDIAIENLDGNSTDNVFSTKAVRDLISGISQESIKKYKLEILQDSSTPQPLILPANSELLYTIARVKTPFAGAAPYIKLVNFGNTEVFIDDDMINLKEVGLNKIDIYKSNALDTNLYFHFSKEGEENTGIIEITLFTM